MTVKALEGTLQIPTAPPAVEEALGFDPRKVPTGEVALSEFFYPNPDNEPAQTAMFNVFVVSIDFTGEVHLIKRPPSDSTLMPKRKFRAARPDGTDINLTVAPSEAVCVTVQEPENGVGYALAIFSETGGETVHFRMSL